MATREDDILEALQDLLGETWMSGQLGAHGGILLRGLAHALAALENDFVSRLQGTYLHPHGTQIDIPATGPRPSRFVAVVRHDGDLGTATIAPATKIRVLGPNGRVYYNETPVLWRRKDPNRERAVLFRAIAEGKDHDLAFLAADEDNPTAIDPSYLQFQDLSRARTNQHGSLVDFESGHALKDTGEPAVFESDDESLYVQILAAADAGAVGRTLQILGFKWPGVEEPADSELFPGYATLDDRATPIELVVALLDDGGVFTDYTAAIGEETSLVPLVPAAPVVGDAFYFGSANPITFLQVQLDTVTLSDWSIVWEIWDGGAWVTPPTLIDGSGGWRTIFAPRIEVGSIALQAQTAVNGVTAYWVRARVAAIGVFNTQPLAKWAYVGAYQPLALESGSVTWRVLDWKDRGLVLASVTLADSGRDADLDLCGEDRGIRREEGEPDLDYYRRIATAADVASPRAILRAVNRHLQPTGKTGRVIDVGNEVQGFFWDVDAWDYYGPGDKFPENQWKLYLSHWEAFGHFYVLLPWLPDGEFGLFWDDGPYKYLTPVGKFIGPFWDEGFMDGYPVSAATIYKNIYKDVDDRKAGGVTFTLIPSLKLNE